MTSSRTCWIASPPPPSSFSSAALPPVDSTEPTAGTETSQTLGPSSFGSSAPPSPELDLTWLAAVAVTASCTFSSRTSLWTPSSPKLSRFTSVASPSLSATLPSHPRNANGSIGHLCLLPPSSLRQAPMTRYPTPVGPPSSLPATVALGLFPDASSSPGNPPSHPPLSGPSDLLATALGT